MILRCIPRPLQLTRVTSGLQRKVLDVEDHTHIHSVHLITNMQYARIVFFIDLWAGLGYTVTPTFHKKTAEGRRSMALLAVAVLLLVALATGSRAEYTRTVSYEAEVLVKW